MDPDLQKTLDEQSRLIKEIHAQTRSLHRALVWGRVWGLVRFVVFFVVPIVLVYLYVVPAFQKYTSAVQSLFSGATKPEQFMQNLPPMFQSVLKFQGLDIETLQKQMQAQQRRMGK
jgi:predicted PurR-regulated permease PerM